MPNPNLLDAHLHLQDSRFSGQLETVIDRARSAGVTRMYCNATCEDDWQQVIRIADNYPGVLPFLGIHPWHAGSIQAGWESRLACLLEMTASGIGEVGLDRRCGVDVQLQTEIFTTQLRLACRYNRPLVIHCLKCWGRLIDLLEKFSMAGTLPSVMLHSFSGSTEIMERLVTLGCYLSFSAAMTCPAGEKIREVFQQTPLENILLETDAPDQVPARITGAAIRGKKVNEPAFIPQLYRFAAEQKALSLQEISRAIWHNGTIFSSAVFQ